MLRIGVKLRVEVPEATRTCRGTRDFRGGVTMATLPNIADAACCWELAGVGNETILTGEVAFDSLMVSSF